MQGRCLLDSHWQRGPSERLALERFSVGWHTGFVESVATGPPWVVPTDTALANPQALAGYYRAGRGSSPPDSRDNPERFPLALPALRNGRSSALSTRRDPGLASRSPVSIACT
jgi:hypothetical protein